MVGPLILQRAQMLVEETRQKIDEQQQIVANLEKRGSDATGARKLLAMWEEALVRRVEILNQMRTRSQAKRDRK